jgi:arylsulfatase A-like enzyme
MYRAIRIAVLLLCAALLTSVRADNKRPNIVIFLADDLGYADIGAQGILKDVRTPNIDAIAKAGTRFTNGYVSCPVCSPTRAGLMTGRYQTRFGHEVNCGPDPAPNFGLPVDQVTIAQALKDSGYTTGAFGKWHLGFNANQHR